MKSCISQNKQTKIKKDETQTGSKQSDLKLAGCALMLAISQGTAMVLSNNTLADQKKHDDCLSDHAESLVNHSHSGRLLWAPSMLPQGNQTPVCTGPCADSCTDLLNDKALVLSCMMLVLGSLAAYALVKLGKAISTQSSAIEADVIGPDADEKTPLAEGGSSLQYV